MLKAEYSSFAMPTASVSADSDVVTIPDAHLLFTGQFSRTTHDLILTDADGSRFVVSGYFDRAEFPALVSPEGAMLLPDVVRALAGPLAPGQYAQAGGGEGGVPIGKVTALSGTATAQHADGTVVELHVGDPVFKGDVLQSGPQASVGIVFTDETVFSLSANARMVLNELVYQQGGGGNALTFSLVEGTFAFVAGKVAPTGEMKVNTPVASMGIRGTCVLSAIANAGETIFGLCPDPVTNAAGAYQILRLSDGSLLATVNTIGQAFSLSSATGQIQTLASSQVGTFGQATEDVHKTWTDARNSGLIQGSLDQKGPQHASNGDSTAVQTAIATETPGETQSLGAGAGISIASPASEPLLTVAELFVQQEDSSSTESTAFSAEQSTTSDAGTSTTPPGPPPPSTDPTPSDPVDGTATEGASSSTLDALANTPGGGTVTGLPSTLPAGVTFNPDTQTFTLDPTDPAYDDLGNGETESIRVDFQVDSGSTTTPASVRWTVTGSNDAPVAGDDGPPSISESTPLNINVLDNDSDVDGDTLTISGLPTALHGTVTVNSNGTLNYAPDAFYSGPDTITYEVTDGTTTDTGQVTITVNAVADAPSLVTPDASGTTNTAIPLSFSSALTDTDGSETLSINISGLAGATLNQGTLNGDGSYTLTAAQLTGLTITPPLDSDAAITLTVTATATEGSNGDTETTTDTVLVTVSTDVADVPSLVTPDASGNEDTAIALNFSAALTDTDSSETLSINISGLAGATLNQGTLNGDGSYTLTAAQLTGLTLTPPANSDADITLTVTATATETNGGDTATITDTVLVTVTAVADAPSLVTPDASGTTNTAIPLSFSSALTDTDGSETLSINISGLAGATLNQGTLNDDGSYTLTPAELVGLTLTPPADSTDDITLTVTATATETNGGDTETNTDTVLVTVNPDGSPVAIDDGPVTTNEDAPLNNIDVLGNDTGGNGPLSISGTPTALHGTVSVNGDGTLNYMPDANYSGADTITYDVTDGTFTDTGQVAITVTAVADAPSLTSPNASGNEDTPIALSFSSALIDTDGSETLTINISGLAGATLNKGTLNGDGSYTLTTADLSGLTITPPANSDADITLTVTATATEGSNGDIATNTDIVVVTVNAVADAPSLTTPDASGNEGTAIPLSFSSALTDTDGSETLSIKISGLAGATLNQGTLNGDGSYTLTSADLVGLTLTPPANSDADITLTVTATATETIGGDTETTTDTVVVTVNAVADAPSLTTSDASGNEDTAIPLSFSSALTDTDGSETLSINISGLAGATLNQGTLNGDGSYTLTAAQLTGLTLTPPANSDADITLTVTATATETTGGDTETTTDTVLVTVNAVADAPSLVTPDASGTTNTAIPLNFSAALTDTDGSETLSIHISGLAGATLNTGTLNADGSYTLTAADLVGLTLTPPADSEADITLTVTATATETTGGDTETTTDTVLVTVNPPGAPVAGDDGPITTNEDTPLNNIDVLENDTGGNGPLSISGIPTALHGTVTVNGDGTLNYTPDANYSGADTITYRVTDGTTNDIGEVAITVTAVADAPSLTSPNASGNEDTAIALNFSSALTDTDGSETLSINISGLAGATLNQGTLNGDGSYTLTATQLTGLTLTPPPNSEADITLTVTATATETTGGDTETTTDTVLVTVNAVADAPSLTSPNASGNEDTAIALNFSSALTDTDGSETLSINISGLAGATLNQGTLNGDGSYTLTAAQLTGLTLTPPPNSDADITLTVTATATETTGGDTETTTDTVLVTVNAVADAPSLTSPNASGNEDTAIALNFSSALTDTDGSETLSINISGLAGATLNQGTLNGDGSYTLTAAQLTGLTLTPPANSDADITLTVTATATETTGGDTETTTDTVLVTVNAVADAPSLTSPNASGNEDTAIALSFSSALTDTDGSETLSINISGLAGATLNQGTLNGDGSYTLTAAQLTGLTLTPPANSDADITLTVTATATETTGGDTETTTDTVLVTVTAVADAPSLTSPNASGTENTAIALNFSSALTDTDGSETLSINISGLAGATLNQGTLNGDGSYTLTAADLTGLTITPPLDSEADITLTVTVTATETTGGDTETTTDTVLIMVNPVGETVAVDDGPFATNEDTPLNNINVLGNDTPGNGPLSIFGIPTALHGTVTVNGDGTLNYTPDANYGGADTITYQVTDGTTNDTGEVAITVTAVADAPSLTSPNASGNEDTAIALSFSSALTDTDGSETLSINISGLAGATLNQGTLNGDGSYTLTAAQLTGLTLTPPPNSDADITLTVTATATETTGGDTETTTDTVLVTVTAVADAPSLTSPNASGNEDTAIALSFSSALTDTDGTETLSINISGLAGATLNQGTLNGDGSYTLTAAQLTGLTLTPPSNSDADITLTVTATATETTGGDTETTTDTVLVTVNAVADAPSLTSPNASGNEDTAIALSFSSALTDTDGSETLSINISGLAGATLNQGTLNVDGSYTLTAAQLTGLTLTPPPNSDADITLTVTATATETTGGDTESTTDTVVVTVNAVADAPSLTSPNASGNEDTAIALSFSSAITDTDGSETLSINISGLAGATLNKGTLNGDGSYTLTSADLVGLTLTPPANSDADITLTVTATTTEITGGDTETTTDTVLVTVNAVADAPSLTSPNASGNEDTAIALSFSSALTDTDGSETLSINISGLAGATLNQGTLNGDGSYTLTAAQLTGLTLTPPPNSDADITLTVTATATETNGGDTETTTDTVLVTVNSVNDAPVISNLGPTGTSTEQVAAIIDSNVAISDPELDAGNYGGSTLTVVRNGGSNAQDAFSFNTSGASFTANAGVLRDLSLNVIGNYSTAGNTLVIAFTALATSAIVDNVVQHIAYANTSDTPPASITLDYTFSDGQASDTESIMLSITPTAEGPAAVPDNVITNIALGNNISIPELALLANDGGALDVATAGGASGGSVTHNPGTGSGGSVVFVDLSPAGGSFTYNATDGTTTGAAGTVTVSFDSNGALEGTAGNDILIGANGGTMLIGHQGDDQLVGGVGVDTYVWSANDGEDTVLQNGTGANEDIISISGTFYDYNWEVDGDDLIVGVVADDTYQWAGGNIRIADYFAGGDSIAYLTGDLGDNNAFYSPGGGDARIYLSAVNGTNQGNFFESIVGTSAGETMTSGGGAIDFFSGLGGDDTMSVANGTRGLFRGGDGIDIMTGANQDDQFIGGEGNDTFTGNGHIEGDEVRYDRFAGSGPPDPLSGVFVNLSGATVTRTFNGVLTSVEGGHALDNWGDTDTLFGIEDVRGSDQVDIIVGNGGGNRIQGLLGNDTLMGRGGADVYVWSANDGFDTILSNGGALNEDVVRIRGSFYDLDWTVDGDDLIVGAVTDETYQWAGGNLRIEDFLLPGGDIINYMIGDVGPNNEFYSPGGGEEARIYFSAVNGANQGNYFEAIIGTSAGETMTSGGGAIDFFSGGGGGDTMSVANGTRGLFRGGDGIDIMTGADQDDEFIGGEGNDQFTGNGHIEGDEVRYDRFAGSGPPDPVSGVFVNLSGDTVTRTFNGVLTSVEGGHALDNWGDTDALFGIEDVRGSDEADIIVGNGGSNRIRGRLGDDILIGHSGNDHLLGGPGNDQLFGEADDDILEGFEGDDLLNGGAGEFDGADYFSAPTGVIVNLQTGLASDDGYGGTDTLVAIEQIYASFNDDQLTGNSLDNWIEARDGADVVFGGGGRDQLFGGSGDDELNGEDDNDTLEGGAGFDHLDGGDGEDTVSYFNAGPGLTVDLAAGTASNDGEGGTDTLANIEYIFGSFFADSLTGDGVKNIIEGSQGADTLDGAGGSDAVAYFSDPGFVTVNLLTGQATDGYGDTDTISNFEEIIGSSGADQLTGDAGANLLEGLGGGDTLNGGGGEDFVDHFNDPDGINANLATGIVVDGYGGHDTLLNIEGILASFHDDILTGTGAGNVIEARDGNDIINMPDVMDAFIDGGLGQDTLVLNGADDIDLRLDPNLFGIETVNLNNTGSALSLTEQDVIDIGELNNAFTSADSSENLVVEGTENDSLFLYGDWVLAESNVELDGSFGGAYDVYNHESGATVTASLAVDHDVQVNLNAV